MQPHTLNAKRAWYHNLLSEVCKSLPQSCFSFLLTFTALPTILNSHLTSSTIALSYAALSVMLTHTYMHQVAILLVNFVAVYLYHYDAFDSKSF